MALGLAVVACVVSAGIASLGSPLPLLWWLTGVVRQWFHSNPLPLCMDVFPSVSGAFAMCAIVDVFAPGWRDGVSALQLRVVGCLCWYVM